MPGFFDVHERLKELSAKRDDLERIKSPDDFEMFRLDLEAAARHANRSKGGPPPFWEALTRSLEGASGHAARYCRI